MKNAQLLLFGLITAFGFFVIAKMSISQETGYGMFILPVFIVIFFILNLIVRKSPNFRPYFTHKWNLLTTKFHAQEEYDIPVDLMVDKISEVINDSTFKLTDVNKAQSTIMATSSMTMKSWGENIYIDLKADGEKTLLDFCSVTMFQMVSWGKNESNYNKLLAEIEDALII